MSLVIVVESLVGKNALILASTDLTHYESQEIAERKDKQALVTLNKMNEREFYSTIETNHITTCGYGPVIALITASKLLGATKSQLLCYQTSGDITGDYSSVVGYASVKLDSVHP